MLSVGFVVSAADMLEEFMAGCSDSDRSNIARRSGLRRAMPDPW